MYHTRPRHIIIYALLNTFALAGLWSCRKDVEVFKPYPPTLEAIRILMENVPSATTQTPFVLSGTVPDTALSTPGGVRVFLTDNEHLFADMDGNPVPCSTCQTLRVEVTEILDKGDIIARGIPTTTTSNELLESGGMVRIVVTCDGKSLQLLPDRKLKIQIPADNPVADMLVFEGVVKNDTFIGWQDTGLPVFQAQAWNAIFAPKGTPAPVIAKLNEAVGKALNDENVRKRLLDLGAVIPGPADRTPEALAALVKSEIAKWTPVLKPAT